MTPVPPRLERPSLDPFVWRACAGVSVKIPAVGSFVYYFPQGHAEQTWSPLDVSSIAGAAPYVLARVIDVRYVADDLTHEVFARIYLDPRVPPSGLPHGYLTVSSVEEDEEDGGVVSFAKILTQSDANNGGGFSVPRFCAESIFPQLNYAEDPPVQNLRMNDVNGNFYEFRHIYRGTPRRHLLTTGWSKFVNKKKLISRDSVIFIRDRNDQLFVGVRRAPVRESPPGPVDSVSPSGYTVQGTANPVAYGEDGWRITKGRVPPESVVEAATKAQMKQPFEVLFYPAVGSPVFVVAAEMVEAASRVNWASGMRVRMSMETEDSSRTTWLQGTVSTTRAQDSGPWAQSPWRMLQVIWDEPEVLQQVRNVSPWQVELFSHAIQPQGAFQEAKRHKAFQTTEFCIDGESNGFLASTGLSTLEVGSCSTPLPLSYNILPVDIQGARHGLTGASSLTNSTNFSWNLARELHGINKEPKQINVSTELNLGSASQSGSSSPQSQVSTAHQEREASGGGTLQLFGQVIELHQPLDTDSNREYNGHEGAVRSLNVPLHFQHEPQVYNVHASCQGCPAARPYSL